MYFFDPQNTTVFIGYDTVESRSNILSIIYNDRYEEHIILEEGDLCKIIVDISPFFPVHNSQISDMGWIHNDNIMLKVIDVDFTDEGDFFHSVECKHSGSLQVGDRVFTHIDTMRRENISRNHTAAHLLYCALKDDSGEKINGYSSYASDDKLCFDFLSHSMPSKEQIYSLEKRVNAYIMSDYPVLTYMTSGKHGEEICSVKPVNYHDCGDTMKNENLCLHHPSRITHHDSHINLGRKVRICQIGDISCEICEGTHCIHTGDIGMFKITSLSDRGDGFFRLTGLAGNSEQ